MYSDTDSSIVSGWIDFLRSSCYILLSSVVLTPKVIGPEGKDEKNLIRENSAMANTPSMLFSCAYRGFIIYADIWTKSMSARSFPGGI